MNPVFLGVGVPLVLLVLLVASVVHVVRGAGRQVRSLPEARSISPQARLALREAMQPSRDRGDGFRSYADHGTPHYASLTAAGCERDGEPVFVLRAQDKHAPAAVRTWAYGVTNPEMQAEALRIAKAMEEWPQRKEPD